MFDCFMSSMSRRMDSSEMTWPVRGSCSCRLTPLRRTAAPLTRSCPSLISEVLKPIFDVTASIALPLRIRELEDDTVEVGRLGAPPRDVREVGLEADDGRTVAGRDGGPIRAQGLLPGGVEERHRHRRGTRPGQGVPAELDRYIKAPIPVARVESGPDLEVADVDLGRGGRDTRRARCRPAARSPGTRDRSRPTNGRLRPPGRSHPA